MTFKLRRLRLRALTERGWYGVELGFTDGLNVLWADNTMGKSTCLQGMIYVLGLERMLSPRREIPLPHAMTSHLVTDTASNFPVRACANIEACQPRMQLRLDQPDIRRQ